MGRRSLLVGIVLLVLAVGSVPPANAQLDRPSEFKIDARLTYWHGSATASGPGGPFGDWSTRLFGLELDFSQPPSRWGFGLNFFGGGQYNGGGSWTGLESGSDQIWGAWVNYRLLPPTSPTQINAWGGYGSYAWETTFSGGSIERFRSDGFMVGVSIYTPLAPNVDFGGTIIFHPSNSTSVETGGILASSSASAWDYRVNLKFESGNWAILGGYRAAYVRAGDITTCPECEFRWSGPYLSFIYTR